MVRYICYKLNLVLLLIAAMCAGCSIQPKQEAMVPSSRVTTFEAKKVFSGRIGYKSLKTPATKFDFAVEAALRNQGWLNKTGSPEFYLTTSRFSESVPKNGFSMTGSLLVTYTLSSSSGTQIWLKSVDTTIKKGLADNLIGVSRAEAIVEDYVRINIAEMIDALDAKGRQIELQRQASEQTNQQLMLLGKQFVDSDIFSGKDFFDLCADPICLKQGNKVVIVSETSKSWLPKVKDASSAKVQRFFGTYGGYLYAAQRSEIQDLIRTKRKSEQQNKSKQIDHSESAWDNQSSAKGVAF